jgi:uncharacterized membrane protein HdeD (DUF308 family)
MSEQALQSDIGLPPTPTGLREVLREVSGYWWLGLAAGTMWMVASLVILQFNDASVKTVGIITGLLFTLLGVQNLAFASVPIKSRWVPAVFGVLFLISGLICFARPEDTFAGMADILGFLFMTVAIWWMVRAFLEKPLNPTWWLGLIAGVLMTGVAFWTAGQFFTEKAYVLLILAGIWSLTEGITDVVRAFEIRRLHESLEPAAR